MRARSGAWLAVVLVVSPGLTACAGDAEPVRVQGRKAAAHAYLGDPGLDSPGPTAVAATPDETTRGFAVLAASPFALPAPDAPAAAPARCSRLFLREAPGQHAPLAFTVAAISPASFSVAATDLAGPGGRALGAACLDVRAVRCAKVSYQNKTATIRWEAVREGVKDRRYLATLEKAMEGKTGPAADAARALLAEIDAAIELKHADYDPINGGRIPAPPPEQFDAWRGRVQELIVKLR